MIRFPKSIDEAVHGRGEWRAGGTDLMERRKSGRTTGDIVDLRDVPGLDGIEVGDRIRIGAKVSIADLAADERIPQGIRVSAGALATPQIRAVATVAGNLRQKPRCWYYRNPQFECFRTGGNVCNARSGDHLYHVCFDQSSCAAPHPSTLAAAFLAYDAEAETPDGMKPLADVLGDERIFVTAIHVSPAWPGERAAYFRAISRAYAEWPLVEAVVRLRIEGEIIRDARVVIGGVAPLPLRREAVEGRLVGHGVLPEGLLWAASLADEGAEPLPGTKYKVGLLAPTVLETLERAVR